MRGYRLPKSLRKLDVVLVAVRYSQRKHSLQVGQAYVRRGPIWGDLTLIDRDDLVDRLQSKQRVATGRPAKIPGEFIVYDQVQLHKTNAGGGIHVGEPPAKGDDLGLPLF